MQTVQLQCPQCKRPCQVQAEHLGRAVRCPQCGQAFIPAAEPRESAATGSRSGFWKGLRGMFTGPVPTARLTETHPGDSDMELQLDGPAAAAMMAPSPEPAAGRGLRFDVAGATTAGRVRPRNEDSSLIQQLCWANLDRQHALVLAVVADGMGGYEAGDKASAMVIRQFADAFAPVFATALNSMPTGAAVVELLDKTIKNANRAVQQQGQTDSACKGMGATAAAVVIADEEVRVGHVGDCRVYHLHAGELKQITRDQTLVARMVELGKLTPAEAATHPQRNEVTQAIGKHADIHPAAHELRLAAGDWLLIACDGLHAHVDAASIRAATTQTPSASALAQHLVNLANERGGSDNCTVIAVRCSS